MSDTHRDRNRKGRRPSSGELRVRLEDYAAVRPTADLAECVRVLEADGYAMPPTDGWEALAKLWADVQADAGLPRGGRGSTLS